VSGEPREPLSPSRWHRLWDDARALLEGITGLDAGPAPDMPQHSLENIVRAEGYDTLQKMYERLLEEEVSPEGLVLWLCATRILSSLPLCQECVRDFATELVRQSVSEKEATVWNSVWLEVAPRARIEPNLVYNPSVTYPHLHRAVGENGLRTMMRELVAYVRSGAVLSFSDYVFYLGKRVLRFVASIDDTDRRIISALLRQPDLQIRQLAQYLNLSTHWVSSKVAHLRRRMILREFDVVPFSQIRIRMFHLFLRREDESTDLYNLVSECPFLYGHRQVLMGDWDFYAVLCEPEGVQRVRWQEVFVQRASLWGVDARISEIRQSGSSYSLDFYVPRRNRWEVPWAALGLWMEKLSNGERCGPPPLTITPSEPTSLRLDELDMRIVDAVRRGVKGVSAIRRVVRAGQNKVAAKLRRLFDAGVIEKRWEIAHLGLVEGIMAYTDDKDAGAAITQIASQLPRAIVSVDELEHHVLTANLPEGGAPQFIKILRPFQDRVRFAVLDDYVYGGWGLPISLWDAKTQRWRVPIDKVRAWLDGLR